ncbi:hypothetical protein [Geomonas propionica]|uniref:DUF4440 domain-containing protein n=1 Tax=Geomonas propionica TaxID=2798582 RepID=A0ABS0YN67_9BACT|nr:hypothetical protein [Geomonas propionica]MBJ6799428.1 hypothetical protein [Geomonas propionica]
MKGKIFLTLLLAFATLAQVTTAAELKEDVRITKAKRLFERYVSLEHAFEPAAADLYSDEAVIRNKRTYPTGQIRELTMPAPTYKELLRKSMPLAKLRGDTSTYADVSYSFDGDGVRIKADRYSNLKKYHSPLSVLVKPSSTGEWLVYEELSESQP